MDLFGLDLGGQFQLDGRGQLAADFPLNKIYANPLNHILKSYSNAILAEGTERTGRKKALGFRELLIVDNSKVRQRFFPRRQSFKSLYSV